MTEEGSSDAGRPIGEDPLCDRIVGRVGFGQLADRLPGDRRPLFWYAVAVLTVEVVGLQGYRLATGQVLAFVANPLWLVRPLVLVGAAVATGSLHERYRRAVSRSNLLERTAEPERFETLVPDRLSATVVALGVGFAIANAFVLIGVPTLYAAGGATRVARFVVVTPFGYVPVLGTFLATYIAVEVLTPRRLERSDVGLDYLDPEKLGGMRPIGELVKFAYYYLVLGLIAYAVAVYGPFVLGGAFAYTALGRPGAFVNLAFTAVWGVSVGTMAYGIYVLHRHMRGEKREVLHSLDRRSRESIDEPWDITRFDVSDAPDEFERYRRKVDHVTSTKEYPATFTMWTQLVVGILLPKAIQFVLSSV